MIDLLRSAAASSLNWLCSFEIRADDIQARLQQALGCWAAEILTGVRQGQPGDEPLRRLLDLPEFETAAYSGDPLLALALNAALSRRGLGQASLTELAARYARAIDSADPELTPGLNLARALQPSASQEVQAVSRKAFPDLAFPAALIAVREELLALCRTAGAISVWGNRPLEMTEVAHLLPPLALSYAMDWDLEAVCTILRTCAYLGLADEPGCRWAEEWLLEQHVDGRFGLILRESQLSGVDLGDAAFFTPTVRALWALAEMRQPGFLLDTRRRPTVKMRLRPLGESRIEGRRLALGTPAPPIQLVDLYGGGEVSLSDYRGSSVLLIFIDPDCDPCDEVISQLVELDRQRAGREPQILMVSRGKPAATRRKLADHVINFPVVLQDHWSVSRQYGVFSFPAAFLIDENGIATRDAVPGPRVTDLLRTFQPAATSPG